ncbi:hypothetical protein Tco_0135207 [Tanacetum coccineum]
MKPSLLISIRLRDTPQHMMIRRYTELTSLMWLVRNFLKKYLVFRIILRVAIPLQEMETFLQTPDELTDLDDDFYDTKGDILYLEQLLNKDPSPTLSPKNNEDLKEVTKAKPSIEEPPELELKDLPSH